MVRRMNQGPKVVSLSGRRLKHQKLSDKEKIIYSYHLLSDCFVDDAIDLLKLVSKDYYEKDLHKDISRALLCYATKASSQNIQHGKESEFYLVVYRLVKMISEQKLYFKNSEYFVMLKDQLFKDFM